MTQNAQDVAGTLEIVEPSGAGFLRDPKRNYSVHPTDPSIPRNLIQRLRLRGGEAISGRFSPDGHGQRGHGHRGPAPAPALTVRTIQEKSPDAYTSTKPFDELTVINPTERLRFETAGGPMTTRVVDLWTPIGKGQRGLIVASPRTGKTVLLQHMAQGIKTNHPECRLMMLLVDERPEEVTEMRRALAPDGGGWNRGEPEVVFSSNDKDAASHARIAKLMIDRAKRVVEQGRDVVIMFDSLTRLGRAHNNLVGSSGRTMTGGLDIRALEIPKQLFGAARKIEHGGSLTIIASVLVETGSRMDEFIFQEFKGTGNMELVLTRELADRRIFPAVNLQQSGTRKEELLIEPQNLDKLVRLRRRLLSMQPQQQLETLLAELGKHPSNQAFFGSLA